MMQKIASWTPRQYRWMKVLASSRDKPFGAVLLWLYSWWCRKSFSWTPCQYRWTKVLDSSRDEPTIRYKIEKKKYINVVCANEPLIIKLEWNSIEVSCKRIQLGNSYLFMRVVCTSGALVCVGFITLFFISWMNICIYEIWSHWY